MNAFRKLLLWVTSGGLLGGLVGALGGQFFVPKFNAPISGVYAQCDCASVTLGTAAAMFRWTLIGTILGALGGLVVGLIGAMAREKKPDAPPPASSKSA
jgi:ABC-type amino acid transport system permease subunit